VNVLPTLKRPSSDAVGEEIYVLGSHWVHCARGDLKKVYVCIVRAYEAVHDWTSHPDVGVKRPFSDKTCAFQMQLMGEKEGAALDNGDVFWMQYPQPFLQYYYAAHPLNTGQAADRAVDCDSDAEELGECRGHRNNSNQHKQ